MKNWAFGYGLNGDDVRLQERGLWCIISDHLYGTPCNTPLHLSFTYLIHLISSCTDFSIICT